MIGILLKNWRFLIDVVLVAALVLLLFWWNPLGIFGGGLKLEDTANLVTEVNEIQQLVTAEYYGEVIASIQEARINPLDDEAVKSEVALLYKAIYQAIDGLRQFQRRNEAERIAEYRQGEKIDNWRRVIKHDVNSRNIREKLHYLQYLEELEPAPHYNQLLAYLWRRETSHDKDDQAKESDLEETLFRLYENPRLAGSLSDAELDRFMQDFHYQNQEALSRKAARKRLTMIGRGWVKAGFDFSELGSESIIYDEEKGVVHIIGATPKILNADINPWFIPEKGVPGFQILDESGAVNFHDARMVKEYCVQKLTVQAYNAQILENASKQGAETLKNLFSLLTGKQIDHVIFHTSPLVDFARLAEADELVTYAEAYMLDSLIRVEHAKNSFLKNNPHISPLNRGFAEENDKVIRQLIRRFRHYAYSEDGEPFGYYSLFTSQLARDSLIDDRESQLLRRMREVVTFANPLENTRLSSVDSIKQYWFDDPFEAMSAYNRMVSKLAHSVPGAVEGREVKRFSKQEVEAEDFFRNHQVINYLELDGDWVEVTLQVPEKTKQFYDSLYYPIETNLRSLDKVIHTKDTVLMDREYPGGEALAALDSGYWFRDRRLGTDQVYRWDQGKVHYFSDSFWEVLVSRPFIYPSSEEFLGRGGAVPDWKDSVSYLTAVQKAEIMDFLVMLVHARDTEQNKGALERAKDWMLKRTEQRQAKSIYLTRKGIHVK